VDLSNISALQPDGPKDPFQQLRANGEALSLAVLGDKGLAAGTDSGTADIFSVSALQPDGPKDPSQQLQPSGDVHFSAVLDDKRLAAGTVTKYPTVLWGQGDHDKMLIIAAPSLLMPIDFVLLHDGLSGSIRPES
jgi:hypothetical protein